MSDAVFAHPYLYNAHANKMDIETAASEAPTEVEVVGFDNFSAEEAPTNPFFVVQMISVVFGAYLIVMGCVIVLTDFSDIFGVSLAIVGLVYPSATVAVAHNACKLISTTTTDRQKIIFLLSTIAEGAVIGGIGIYVGLTGKALVGVIMLVAGLAFPAAVVPFFAPSHKG